MGKKDTFFVRSAVETTAEVEQKIICQALGFQPDPIGSFKTIIDRVESVVPTETA